MMVMIMLAKNCYNRNFGLGFPASEKKLCHDNLQRAMFANGWYES